MNKEKELAWGFYCGYRWGCDVSFRAGGRGLSVYNLLLSLMEKMPWLSYPFAGNEEGGGVDLKICQESNIRNGVSLVREFTLNYMLDVRPWENYIIILYLRILICVILIIIVSSYAQNFVLCKELILVICLDECVGPSKCSINVIIS